MTTMLTKSAIKSKRSVIKKKFGVISINASEDISWDIKSEGKKRYKTFSISVGDNVIRCRVYGPSNKLEELKAGSTIFASAKLLICSNVLVNIDDIRALPEPLNFEIWDELHLELSEEEIKNHLCFKKTRLKDCLNCIDLHNGGVISYCN